MRGLSLILRVLLFAAPLAVCVPAAAFAQDVPATGSLSAGEIDSLVAPIALYPDQLLSKVLIASTYPLEIVQASRWADQNANLKGSQRDTALAKQSWDDSVKSLTSVPDVLKMMNDRIDWAQKLGDAFLSQQKDVLDAVQRLRGEAQKTGNLKTTSQQNVDTDGSTIVIESAQPDIVYVPYYDPNVVYGSWAYPSYPPYYWPPPYGYGAAAGIGFIAGAAIATAWWNNGVNWHGGNVYVNHNTNFNNINRNNFNGNNFNRQNLKGGQGWQHNASHRRGVNYNNAGLRNQYGKGQLAGANARQNFRGYGGTGQGLGSRGSLGQSSLGSRTGTGLGTAAGGGTFDRSSFSGRDFGSRGSGFSGIGNGASTRSFSSRGNRSMSGGFSGRSGGFGGRSGGFGGRGGGRRR